MNGWTDYLAIGAALQKRWPQADVVGMDGEALSEKLRALPETAGFGDVPDTADFVFAVKTAWLKARLTEDPDTSIDALV